MFSLCPFYSIMQYFKILKDYCYCFGFTVMKDINSPMMMNIAVNLVQSNLDQLN